MRCLVNFVLDINISEVFCVSYLPVVCWQAPRPMDDMTSAVDAANEALASIRLSSEHTNGHPVPLQDSTSESSLSSSPVTEVPANGAAKRASGAPTDQAAVLRAELERTRAEKDTLDEHYRTLLEKVTAMRTTLGNKLKQDAVRVLNSNLACFLCCII
jgi:hypothetical protein